MVKDHIISRRSGLPSASTRNTRQDVEEEQEDSQPVVVEVAATGAAGTTRTTPVVSTVVRGVSNVPDPPDTVSPMSTKRPPPLVDDDHDRRLPVATTTTIAAAAATAATAATATEAMTANVDPEANLPAAVDTESQAVVPLPEPTGTTPVWEAYLVPESRRNTTTIETVDAVVWDNTDIIRRSDRQKWALLLAGTLCVVAVIAVALWWTRNTNVEDRSITVVNGPPSSAPTTIFSSTGRLGDILREIMSHFESPTLEQDLTNPESPQYLAALWMAETDQHPATANLTYPLNQRSLDLLQFRQRYALATFYYATDGDRWTERCNFLSPSLHVCEWFCGVKDDPFNDFPGQYSWIGIKGVLCGRTIDHELKEELPALDDLVLRLELGT